MFEGRLLDNILISYVLNVYLGIEFHDMSIINYCHLYMIPTTNVWQ